ncbi:MAG: helix-turn-helix domain-containing protein [Chloroflexales bacterium]|nr:helix-turn-helix domain-containing protein [Chloroflexales bacterium]
MEPQEFPLAELTLADIETIKVVADERRLAILRILQQPATVKELAAQLSIPSAKLYYHVNLLEQHRLLRVVATQVVSGIIEKRYQVTARQLRIRNPLLAGDKISNEAALAIFTTTLDETKEELRRAFLARPAPPPEGPPLHPFVTRKALHLTEEQLLAFHARLDALIKEVDALETANRGQAATPYRLTLAFYQHLPSEVATRDSDDRPDDEAATDRTPVS